MKKFIKGSYFSIIMAFIYIPVVVMILFSFNAGSTTFSWVGFDSKWYSEFFNHSPFVKSIITSLFVAIISTVISLIIGVAAAIGLSRSRRVTQKSWMSIANIPLINADVVTAVSLMIIFLLSGIKFGIVTLIMAHISFNVPYVLITVMPRLRKVDKSLIEAGLDLGAKPHQVLFKIILPILKPAIIAAAAIAFAMSFDDFIISYFTGGSQTNVSTFIYTAKKIRPYIFAFGTIMVAIIVLAIVGWNAISIYKQQKINKIERIKNDTYKIQQLSHLNKELDKLKLMITTNVKIGYTTKLHLWVKYWILKSEIKWASLKNNDKKISRLEWKQYKIKSEISKEKRYYSRRDNAQKRIEKLTQQLTKAADVKKAVKLTLQIEKLQTKIEFLNEEIKWVENRDELAANLSKKIQKEIRNLTREMDSETNPSKKTLNWYHQKIKKLEAEKIEVEEGKNHYKLRMVVERLKEIRALNYDHILTLNEKLKHLETQIFIQKSFTPRLDAKILKTTNEAQLSELLAVRESIQEKIQIKLTHRISYQNEKFTRLQAKIQKEKIKVSPQLNDESAIHSKGFFTRSWKIIGITLIGLAAFSGLTVAYALNNVYDLVIGNWGEYIDPLLIGEFERENGVKVNYQEYDSNETLYNKLYTFNYDLMVPSDYMVQRLAMENRLETLDYTKINVNQTWSAFATIDAEKLNLSPDLVKVMQASKFTVNSEPKLLLDFALPYFWGDLVIVINPTNNNLQFLADRNIIPDANGQMDQSQLSWNLLWEAAAAGKKVALNNDPKNIFALAAEKKYERVNLESKTDVDTVKNDVETLIKPRNVSLNNDDLMTKVATGNFDFALMYSGDAIYSNQVYNHEDDDNPNNDGNTKFIFGRPNVQHPNGRYETTNVFSDNMVISKNSNHKELAYKFMNFVLQHTAEISTFVGTASPVQEAIDELTGPGGHFEKYQILYKPCVTDSNYHINEKVPGTPGEFEPLAFQYHPTIDDYLVEQFNNIVAGKIG